MRGGSRADFMEDLKKSKTSVLQLLRNPSGLVTVVLGSGVIAVPPAVFLAGEIGGIKGNLDNRPKSMVI